jgi:hypothetical protein
MMEVPSRSRFDEGQRRRRRNWVHATVELPGVAEDDMLRQNGQRKHGTTPGSPRRTRTAKASHINRPAAKLRCAREWDGCGRISVDGLGQHNPDRSEGHATTTVREDDPLRCRLGSPGHRGRFRILLRVLPRWCSASNCYDDRLRCTAASRPLGA